MAQHEPTIGASDEWYTPASLLNALGETYDLDPCGPVSLKHYCVPAKHIYTKHTFIKGARGGMEIPWDGFVFMNPPFGGRNGHIPWLSKFLHHGDGIGIVRAYTSSAWFQDYATLADFMVFPRGKTKFVRTNGTIGKAPGHGIVLLGMGDRAGRAMERSKLGMFIDNWS